MDPWAIIGWMILVAFFGPIALAFSVAVFRSCRAIFLHFKTRNTQIARGQVWVQDGEKLVVEGVFEDGVARLRCGYTSWHESASNWRRRVRSRRLYLVS